MNGRRNGASHVLSTTSAPPQRRRFHMRLGASHPEALACAEVELHVHEIHLPLTRCLRNTSSTPRNLHLRTRLSHSQAINDNRESSRSIALVP